jgi:hypothetical protein
MALELIAAGSAQNAVELTVRADASELTKRLGQAIGYRNHDRFIEGILGAAFSNGGHVVYEAFSGPSGTMVECNRSDGDYQIRFLYNPENPRSRSNTQGLVESFYRQMGVSDVPTFIRPAQSLPEYTERR